MTTGSASNDPQPANRSLEILGLISTRFNSESNAPKGPPIDLDYLTAIAAAHENAGFDRVLIGYQTTSADGFQVAAFAAQKTRRLKFLIAHRPGFVSPTLAARQIASLDHFSGGRIAVHYITGGSDADQARDGDFLTKDERYDRTGEYIGILRKAWTSETPFTHDGAYYRHVDSWSAVKPQQTPHPPVFFAGASDAAIRVAAEHADVYAMFGEPLEKAQEQIERVRAVAQGIGRTRPLQFSLSLRIILGRTEQDAWDRAARILDDARTLLGNGKVDISRRSRPGAVGSQRLAALSEEGAVLDQRLWTEMAGLTGGAGNTTALVGTADQVVEALMGYWHLGIDKFLFRGFDPLADAVDYGRLLLPPLRAAVAKAGGTA